MIRKCWKIGVKIISSCVRCGARDFAVPWTRVTRVMYWLAGLILHAHRQIPQAGFARMYSPTRVGVVWYSLFGNLDLCKICKIQTAKSKIQTALFGNQSNIQNPTGGFCAWGTPTGNLDHYAIWRGVFDSPGPSIFCAHLFSGSATWKSEVALRL